MNTILEYGFPMELINDNTGGEPARITAVHRDRYELVCPHGQTYGRLKTAQYYAMGEAFPTTGDFVLIDYVENGDSRIIKTLPRRSYFSRLDPSSSGHAEQAVAANFDTVFILQSLNQNFNLRRLERYLALAWQSGAQPVVVLTKADLVDDASEWVSQALDAAVGAEVFAVSSRNGDGLDALSAYTAPGKTVVFLGSSGVGKSSLVNALAGEEIMLTSEIREDDSRGRHTTTHRQLVMLKNGAMIIDTPGMRELGMWDAKEGVDKGFGDVEQFMGQCRFSDCTHTREPGCAVRAAIQSGELSEERWQSYQSLIKEAERGENHAEFMRRKNERSMSITRYSRSMKKAGQIRH